MTNEIWTGPVSAQQVKGATLPGARVSFIPCTGDGKPSCGELAEGWKDAEGRILPNMLAKLKIELPSELWAGAFSAGGQVWKRVLLNAVDRGLVSGLLLADGDYEVGWVDKGAKEAHFTEGFVLFGLDALDDGRLFVATASATPNVSPSTGEVHPGGDQVLLATMREIERRSGRKFEDVTNRHELWPIGDDLRAPARVWRLHNVIFADYGAAYKHAEHATVLAPRIWQAIPLLLGPEKQPEQPQAPKGSTPPTESPPAQPGLFAGIRALPRPVKVGVAVLAVAGIVAAARGRS